jgi:hypothetical protein
MFRKGATAKEVAQPGLTAKRVDDEDVQKAGAIAESAAKVGVHPPALTPRETSIMKHVPGSRQSDGSMGEVTLMRAGGIPDIVANTKEALEEAPLAPRKTAEAPAPEPKQPSPPVMYGGSTGEHAMQTVETGFDRAANKIARKVKSWFD